MFGGVRFGGGATLAIDDAWAMGFDHIALCMGAGKPTVLDIPNGLARGVRQASDFLMALQLTGAAKLSSDRQPAAPPARRGDRRRADGDRYRHRKPGLLCPPGGEIRAALSHAGRRTRRSGGARRAGTRKKRRSPTSSWRMPRRSRRARSGGRAKGARRVWPQLLDRGAARPSPIGAGWSTRPSYTLNHEEVAKAMEEGGALRRGPDAGRRRGRRVRPRRRRCACRAPTAPRRVLPASAILVAAGTQPNTVLAREDGRIAARWQVFPGGRRGRATRSTPVRGLAKPDAAHVLMHRADNGRFISFFGDLHPSFFGNVVKAMGGAKRGYPVVSRALAAQPATAGRGADLIGAAATICARAVHAVHRLTPTIVEVVVHAPAAARAFRPGQFYRLQNYEMLAPRVEEQASAHRAGDGRPGDDRRLDRPGAGLVVGHRAGDGRQFRPLRAAEAGRAGRADGPDRHADRNPRRTRRWRWSAAASAMRCCSPSVRRCGRPARG